MNETSFHVVDRDTMFADLDQFIVSHQVADKNLAVILININHFRHINIVYGYQAGDALLDQFGGRLQKLARSQDYIARIGNSEFIMVLPEIINEGHATLAANKLLGALGEPFDLGVRKHKVTANMGIALFPQQAKDISGLVQKAEIALLASRNSIQAYSIYSDNDRQVDFNSWDIEIELQNARDRDEFELYFQPQVCLKNGYVFGAEALIRWNNHERGYIRPDIFIPVAEKSGQIHNITWWTINAALRRIKDWPQYGRQLKVAVNVSAKVLRDPEFVESVRSALSIWGTDHQQLTLEITESALMEDMSASFITLDELKSLGLNISIDDFGTGYSSMAYFKYIPANELKVDQSFVRYMLENAMDEHIVKTVVEMAHGFDLKVVAEGIENRETYLALKDIGCDIAQGHHIARPMPQKEFIQWLRDYHTES